MKNQDDSIRFADQSKALWLQHNNNNNGISLQSAHSGGSSDLMMMNGAKHQSTYSLGSNSKVGQKNGKNKTCMGRFPFASIIATIITLCGTGVFCGCLYRALSITIEMLASAFKIEIEMEWVKIIQTIVVVISTVMGSLSVILLVVGCLATGATRTQIYTGFRSRLGGRISTGFFVVIVYLLFLAWSSASVLLVVPMCSYYVLMKNCDVKTAQINSHSIQKLDECFSLKNYGITLSVNKVSVCSNELIAFCNQGKEAGPLYVAAFAASSLIALGLVHFLCCLVANYAHIKDGIKLRDYEEAIKEELELRCDVAAQNRKRADL